MERSYSSMLKNTRVFLDFYKVTDTYHEIEGSLALKTANLSAWFQDICEKKLGVYCTFHMCDDPDGKKTIFPVVYHDGSAMEFVYVVFYAEPCDKLPHDVAEVYKAFLAWTSDTLCVGPGSELNMDNFYLDSIIMWFEEEQAEGDEWKGEVAKKYKAGGEYYKLFDEIDRMEVDAISLLKTLEDYRKKYSMNDDIRKLLECLIDGVPILSRMRLSWWCFCPLNDGFPDDYGDYNDGDICIPLSTAILYSPSDGVTLQIEESLNCEYSSGANMNGWNRALFVNGRNGVEDFKDFEKDRNSCVEFAKWTGNYMSRISKWITDFEYE
ncbi:MAG: hypothetical protein IJM04_04125 [Prevotella sp.]|nr:hypothetical protein [Prevotella sp.]